MKTDPNPSECAVFLFTGHHDYELLLEFWSLYHPLRIKRFMRFKGQRCLYKCKQCKDVLVEDY